MPASPPSWTPFWLASSKILSLIVTWQSEGFSDGAQTASWLQAPLAHCGVWQLVEFVSVQAVPSLVGSETLPHVPPPAHTFFWHSTVGTVVPPLFVHVVPPATGVWPWVQVPVTQAGVRQSVVFESVPH